jgi:hypothetical protein
VWQPGLGYQLPLPHLPVSGFGGAAWVLDLGRSAAARLLDEMGDGGEMEVSAEMHPPSSTRMVCRGVGGAVSPPVVFSQWGHFSNGCVCLSAAELVAGSILWGLLCKHAPCRE